MPDWLLNLLRWSVEPSPMAISRMNCLTAALCIPYFMRFAWTDLADGRGAFVKVLMAVALLPFASDVITFLAAAIVP